MSVHRQLRPALHLQLQRLRRTTRLQTQRVAAEIVLLPIAMRRNQELVAETPQRIGGITRQGIEFGRRSMQQGRHGEVFAQGVDRPF